MEITNAAAQQVLIGGNVTFTNTTVCGCNSIIHRSGSGLVKLRGLTNSQCRARFLASFSGNIAVPADGTAGPISLVFAIDGEPVEATRMIVTPTAVSAFFNVSATTYIDVPTGCCVTLAVENSSGPTITVQNANLTVERVA